MQRRVLEAVRYPDGKVRALMQESPNEARRRWQHEVSPKSFHSSIFGNATNHMNVTAYDLAIGGGQASSDPEFYAYLCAVADWRLQQLVSERQGILKWKVFMKKFAVYWEVETSQRKAIIEGNAKYYSYGELPSCVPPLHAGLPSAVVCESVDGYRLPRAQASDAPQSGSSSGHVEKAGK